MEEQFRTLFESEYPTMDVIREKLISPIWKDINKSKLNITVEEKDKNKISSIVVFASQGMDINFVDVELQDSVVLKNNRVMINRYISTHIMDVYSSALIFFHYKDKTPKEWRITYVYKGENNSDTTNAKRYTYLCGTNYHCRTASERFASLTKYNGYPTSDALIEAFSVETLTKEFFNSLFYWYDKWAVKIVKFPSENCVGSNAELTTKDNNLHLIRLITRIMFVWFIKQKDLIPEWVFNKEELNNILKDPDLLSETKGNYYNAILQNLFFGALNNQINKREFAKKSIDGISNNQYGIKILYRDDNKHSFFNLSHAEMAEKFNSVPFLNGGLFECLDWDEPTKNNTSHKVHYVDGFSRNEDRRAFVPNILFWNDDENNLGLINILSRYNFTIEESSPNDVQVALDPELLGKVFENLLGTLNPETSQSARKESGSFYTPREIVSYMVNRSISSYLHEKLPEISEEKIESLVNSDNRIEMPSLLEKEINDIRTVLFNIKIIDPACGSGAFPMGILNKLVEIHLLLDSYSAGSGSKYNLYIKKGQNIIYAPKDSEINIKAEYLGNLKFSLTFNGNTEKTIYNSQDLALYVKEKINEYNKAKNKKTIANLFSQGRIDNGLTFNTIKTKQDIHQIVDADTNDIIWQYKSYNVENKFRAYRNNEQDIEKTVLEKDDDDFEYAKYLYNLKKRIIQDSIYGVDIQPIAVQISKLRFFISLICEQPKNNNKEDNYGYNPLPNLETKFVAANSLISLADEEKDLLYYSDGKLVKLKEQLTEVRKQHFRAETTEQKQNNRNEDETIRKEIIEYLQKNAVRINNERINELKKQASYLEEKISQLPVEIISVGGESSDLFGNFEDNSLSYDKNEEKRIPLEKELETIRKDIQFQENQNNASKTAESLEKLVAWNPYDQTAPASNFFDPEWMFGISDGFDIVIGNPPYISVDDQNNSEKLKEQRNFLKNCKRYNYLFQKWDLYIPFLELGIRYLCSDKGICSMIVPYPLTNQLYGKIIRQKLLEEYNLFEIVDLNGTKIFENATVSNCIPFISKSIPRKNELWISKITDKKIIKRVFIQPYTKLIQDNKNYVWNLTKEERDSQVFKNFHTLGDFCYISKGMVLNSDEKDKSIKFKKEDLISNIKDSVHTKEFIEGKDTEKYSVNRIRYLEYNTERVPNKLSRPTFKELYSNPKLMFNRLGKLQAFLDEEGRFATSDAMFVCVPWHTLSDIKNKSISNSITKFSNYTRDEMEKLSNKVELKYLLGIMNSEFASKLLTNIRGGDYHIYPEHIRNIPIPLASKEEQSEIITLVDAILEKKKKTEDTAKEEKQIDELVNKLYQKYM